MSRESGIGTEHVEFSKKIIPSIFSAKKGCV
jgi:hypothetical protein